MTRGAKGPHGDCEARPCALCRRRKSGETCGGCLAGVLIGVNDNEIQRCDECALFESDADAVEAVRALGEMLEAQYKRGRRDGLVPSNGYTVADAIDDLEKAVEP